MKSPEQLDFNESPEAEQIPTEENNKDSSFEKLKKQAKKLTKIGAISFLTMTGPGMVSESHAGEFTDTKARAVQNFAELQKEEGVINKNGKISENYLHKFQKEKTKHSKGSISSHKSNTENVFKFRKEEIKLSNNSKIVFEFNKNNEIVGIKSDHTSGHEDYLESKKLLNDNYFDVLTKIKGKQDPNLSKQIVELRASDIFFQSKILNKLKELKKENGPEAKFLKKQIANTIENTEKLYGDVFKQDVIKNVNI